MIFVMAEVNLHSLTTEELKALCKEKKLKVSGSKESLTTRLSESSGNQNNYGNWTLKNLQEELKQRKAKRSGTKDQLIQRLLDYDRNKNFEIKRDPNLEEVESFPLQWPSDNLYRSVSCSSSVPDIDIVHINQFFLCIYKDNAGMSEYEAVHRKAYSMLITEFLCALVETVVSPHHFYRAQVNSEETKALTYFVDVAVAEDGRIIQTKCECNAGEGPHAVCKHVAVTCYAVLKFKDSSTWLVRKTCTQRKQQWHAPKKTRLSVSPKKAEHLNLELYEFQKKKRVKGKLPFDPRQGSQRSKEEFTSHVMMSVINFTHQNSKHLGISGILATVSTVGLINDHDYFEVPLGHLHVLNKIRVTPEQAKELEVKTRRQAHSKLWHTERSMRVTASNVAEICSFTERRNKQQYAEKLISPQPLFTEAVLWGKARESTAVECYEAMSHITVQPCGFFISPEYPFLGASPDGLVAEETVLEVKCPFSIKDQVIHPQNYNHVELVENKLHLKKSSPYYYQVQTEMFVTGRRFCDFFIWTNCDEKRIYVDRDNELIETVILPRVKAFYYEYMLPALEKKYFLLK